MSEEELIMLEAQVDMADIISKNPGRELETVSMCFKVIVDSYVAMLGEEDTVKFLEVAVDSVKNGYHTANAENIPKNQLN
jgi:hypothetical protein|tara:strand:+ start:1350 stop:1589 length:240 start_codon:yes stop_codon:yes gene_type:complete